MKLHVSGCLALAFALLLPMTSAVRAQNRSATTVPSDANSKAHADWYQECVQQVAAAQGKPVDIVFIGDSITQGFVETPSPTWTEVGNTNWAYWYANRNALDLGVSADKTQDVLWRLDTMDIKTFHPKVAVIMIGTNNIPTDTADDVAAGVQAVVDKTRRLYPDAKIILVSITPRAGYVEKVKTVDNLIQRFADQKSVFYFDLASYMTPVGDNWKGIGADHLHYSPDGYALWASHMEPLLYRLLNTPPNVKAADLLSSQPPIKIPASGPKLKIACVGDSITAGAGASSSAANYPSVLGDLLGPHVDVHNFGESGSTLLKNGDSPFWQRGSFAGSAQYAPDVVVLMLGTNDTKPQNWGPHAGEFGRDAIALLEYYKNLPSHPRLFVCLPPPVEGTAYGIVEPPIEQQMPILRKAAAQEGATVIDVHDLMPADITYSVDGVHPNDAGYVQLASAVYWGLTHKPAIVMTDDSGGLYSGPLLDNAEVTIAPILLAADMRYAVNGERLTASSPLSTGPIEIHGTTDIAAQAFVNGRRFGDPAAAHFEVSQPMPAASTAITSPGLAYLYYEDSFGQLSDLNDPTPKSKGVLAGFDLTPRERETDFGFLYNGYITIPAKGVYLFSTDSDDGSSLSIDGQLIVDNDGAHGESTVTSGAVLDPGLHKIAVRYFQGTGGYQLKVMWQPPGQPMQPIPASALSH